MGGLFHDLASSRAAAAPPPQAGPRRPPGGEAYADARGDKYLRSSSGGWVDYSTTWHPHELPQRPLRKLVPEGPQSAKPSHFDVLAEIVTGLGRDETGKQLADRICMLRGASDEH